MLFTILSVVLPPLIGLLGNYIISLLKRQDHKMINQFLPVAEEVVKSLQNADLTNEEKRQAAFDQIKQIAEERAADLADSLINWLIETALQKVKGE